MTTPHIPDCVTCGGNEFSNDDGFYYCQECGTKAADAVEINYDLNVNYTNIRLKKLTIPKQKSTKKKDEKLTSWACYNYILVGLVKELQSLGASEKFKLTTLQLWTAYLAKIEVAFTSRTEEKLPKLPVTFKKRDARIIYNRFKQSKRKRWQSSEIKTPTTSLSGLTAMEAARERSKHRRALAQTDYEVLTQEVLTQQSDKTSILNASLHSLKSATSTTNTEKTKEIKLNKKARQEKLRVLSAKHLKEHLKDINDDLKCHSIKKNISSSYLSSGNFVTRTVLWSILYLALNQCEEEIQLGDLIRFCRDGTLSFYDFRHFFPEDSPMLKRDQHIFQAPIYDPPNHLRIRETSLKIAKIIGVKYLVKPNLLKLTRRYCVELQLPDDVNEFITKLFMLTEPVMTCKVKDIVVVPNFEGRAMSFIIFVLKVIFGLNDQTESKISKSVHKLNKIFLKNGFNTELFVWKDWLNYMELRKLVISEKHFPTKMLTDPEGVSTEMYFNFLKKVKLQTDEDDEDLQLIKQVFQDMEGMQNQECKEQIEFKPSLTPNKDNFEKILEVDRFCQIPELLKKDFTKSDLKLLLNNKELQKNCRKCNVDLRFSTNFENVNIKFVEMAQFKKKQTQRAKKCEKEYLNMSVNVRNCSSDFYDKEVHRKKKERVKELKKRERNLKEIQNNLRSGFKKKCKTETKTDEGPSAKKPKLDLHKANVQEIARMMLEKQLKISRSSENADNSFQAEHTSVMEKRNIGRDKNGRFVSKASAEALPSEKFKTRRHGKWFIKECYENQLNESHNLETNKNSLLSLALREKYKEKLMKDNTFVDSKIRLCIPLSSYWINHHGDPYCSTNQLFNDFFLKLPRNFQWLLKECAVAIEMDCKELYTELMVVENQYGLVLNSDNVTENVLRLESCFENVENKMEESIRRLKKYW